MGHDALTMLDGKNKRKRLLKSIRNARRTYRNWPFVLLIGRFGSPKRLLLYELRGGAKLWGRPTSADRGIMDEVWAGRCYNPPGFEICATDCIIDVGAHIGAFSILAGISAKEGKIIAVEAMEENFALLEENKRANGLINIETLNTAVAGKTGKMRLRISADNTGGHSTTDWMGMPEGAESGSSEVEGLTLAELMKRFDFQTVDFLKMDCEGAEYEIIYESKDVLCRIRRIAMETHRGPRPETTRKGMMKFLEENGFRTKTLDEWPDMLYAERKI